MVRLSHSEWNERLRRQDALEARARSSPTKYAPKRYSVGLDLGQAADYSAIAVLERTTAPPQTALFAPGGDGRVVEGESRYDLVYLKRIPLHTSYDRIAERVARMVVELAPRGGFDEVGQISLSVDGTGVGRGVVDMMRAELAKRRDRGEYMPRVDFRPVTITGGTGAPRPPKTKKDYWSLPKIEAIFPLVALFQQSRIRIARGVQDRDALVRELTGYHRRQNIATGNQIFEPWREGDHDDLLFAVALALFGWQRQRPRNALVAVR